MKLSKSTLFILLLSSLGFLIMSYLTYIHYANARSFCDLSETVSCDVVTTSIYSEVFGIPISIMGLLYFGFVFAYTLLNRNRDFHKVVFFITLFVLIPSAYFSLAEVLFIKALCPLCETSKVLMLGILGISTFQIKERFSVLARLSVPVILSGLAAAGITYFSQTGTTAKADYSEFVEALNEKGVVYYKSVRCNNCKRQEMLFGPAIKKLNSIECHPEGENPQPELCLSKGINKTPTFLLEKDGVETGRLEGLQKLKDIADWANVEFKETGK